jgi:hypothetical protein
MATTSCDTCHKPKPGAKALWSNRSLFCTCEMPESVLEEGTAVMVTGKVGHLLNLGGTPYASVTFAGGIVGGSLNVPLEGLKLTCGHSVHKLTGTKGKTFCGECYANSR